MIIDAYKKDLTDLGYGLPSCMRTAPVLIPYASVSTVKGFSYSGKTKTGVITIASSFFKSSVSFGIAYKLDLETFIFY
jgi:hypothetical protein